MKILIVEDDTSTLTLVQHFLKDTGYEVAACRNGEEAFRQIAAEHPEIALIDGLIPGIHGFELCRKIKEDPLLKKTTRVILMTSVYKKQQYRVEVREYQADGFLIKPFSKETLLSAIQSLQKEMPSGE